MVKRMKYANQDLQSSSPHPSVQHNKSIVKSSGTGPKKFPKHTVEMSRDPDVGGSSASGRPRFGRINLSTLSNGTAVTFKDVVGTEFNISTAEKIWASLILRGISKLGISVGEHQIKSVTSWLKLSTGLSPWKDGLVQKAPSESNLGE